MIRSFLILVALASLAMAARPVDVPTFHGAYFVGLVNQDVRRASDAKLDYSLSSSKGVDIQFKTIADVDRTNEASIAPVDFPLWRMLQANCAALKKFEQGQATAKSGFTLSLTESVVLGFPASAVPLASNDDLDLRGDKTLKQHEKDLVITVQGRDEARVTTPRDMWQYVVLAQADFDGDGIEDLLIRVDWRCLEGTAAGSEAFVLSKPTADSPTKVIWRSFAQKEVDHVK